MNKPYSILLFTVDSVFTEVLKRLLIPSISTHKLEVMHSFSQANQLPEATALDLILVDDQIVGSSGLELVSYLRLNKQVLAPIVYFGTNDPLTEKKATLTGANLFIQKPFHPAMSRKITGLIARKQ